MKQNRKESLRKQEMQAFNDLASFLNRLTPKEITPFEYRNDGNMPIKYGIEMEEEEGGHHFTGRYEFTISYSEKDPSTNSESEPLLNPQRQSNIPTLESFAESFQIIFHSYNKQNSHNQINVETKTTRFDEEHRNYFHLQFFFGNLGNGFENLYNFCKLLRGESLTKENQFKILSYWIRIANNHPDRLFPHDLQNYILEHFCSNEYPLDFFSQIGFADEVIAGNWNELVKEDVEETHYFSSEGTLADDQETSRCCIIS